MRMWDRVLPLLLFDPETGKQLGRYDIPARGPGAAVRFDAGAAAFARFRSGIKPPSAFSLGDGGWSPYQIGRAHV